MRVVKGELRVKGAANYPAKDPPARGFTRAQARTLDPCVHNAKMHGGRRNVQHSAHASIWRAFTHARKGWLGGG